MSSTDQVTGLHDDQKDSYRPGDAVLELESGEAPLGKVTG
jgi:hypothetical protein